ncbi:hypothetical protein QE152_g39302 [Popillia japonica]|uniref:Uncharacterized protein n=1 Tax=Popillia japonica TaxID=7064 RepID=A0AAW1HUH2_POPJA
MTRKHRMQVSAIMKANAEQAYKNAKSDYKHAIINAKRSQWTTLLRELDEDIWRDGLVMRHLGRLTLPYNPDMSRKVDIIKQLFLTEKRTGQRGKC